MTHRTDKPKTAEQIEDKALRDFTSLLSYKLGLYIGSRLYENCPDNYNRKIPELAAELLSWCKSQIEKETAKRIKTEIEKNSFVADIGIEKIRKMDEPWWQQFWKEFTGE